MSKLVSVVIPCYNPGNYIFETIESVECQNYKNFEIIIVDDESSDAVTLQALKTLSEKSHIKVFHQKNSGPGVARNFGVENSSGEFIVFLDADDLIRRNTIVEALGVFDKNPNIGVVYGNIQLFQNKNELRKQAPYSLRKMFTSNQITVLTVLRKQTFIDSGGYDRFTSIHGFIEDYDLWLNISETEWEFFYINDTFFDYRILSDSRTTRNSHEKNIALNHIYKKHSSLLHKEYISLYHDHKNLTETIDFKIGNNILKPLRWLKKKLFVFV